MVIYLIDYPVLVALLTTPSASLRRRIQDETAAGNDLVVSAVTLARLEALCEASGAENETRTVLERIDSVFAVAPWPREAARAYGKLAQHNDARVSQQDLIVAAHAASLNAILVTSAVGRFAQVPGLRVEDWTSPDTPVQG